MMAETIIATIGAVEYCIQVRNRLFKSQCPKKNMPGIIGKMYSYAYLATKGS